MRGRQTERGAVGSPLMMEKGVNSHSASGAEMSIKYEPLFIPPPLRELIAEWWLDWTE